MEQIVEDIRQALFALGHPHGTRFRLHVVGYNVFQVFRPCGFVDDELIGIWDATKRTFCD